MEHTPDKCPNKIIITQVSNKINLIEQKMHEKEIEAVDRYARQDEQYKTIINMLNSEATTRKDTSKTVHQLQVDLNDVKTNLAVNNHKTDRTTNFVDALTMTAIIKLLGLMMGAGFIYSLFSSI